VGSTPSEWPVFAEKRITVKMVYSICGQAMPLSSSARIKNPEIHDK